MDGETRAVERKLTAFWGRMTLLQRWKEQSFQIQKQMDVLGRTLAAIADRSSRSEGEAKDEVSAIAFSLERYPLAGGQLVPGITELRQRVAEKDWGAAIEASEDLLVAWREAVKDGRV